MSAPIDLGITVNEGTTLVLTRTILDHNGLGIPNSQLTSLVLTLTERSRDLLIGARDHQNVKGANGGTVSEDGVLTLELGPTDQVMKTTAPEEWHRALLEWTYGQGGGRRGKGELIFGVRRVPRASLT